MAANNPSGDKKDAISRRIGRFLGRVTPWEGGLLSGNARFVKGMAGRPETKRQPLAPLQPGRGENAKVVMPSGGKGEDKGLDADIAKAGGRDKVSYAGSRTGVPVRKGYSYDYTKEKYVKD